MRTLLAQVGEMARRSITQTLRQPALIVPPVSYTHLTLPTTPYV